MNSPLFRSGDDRRGVTTVEFALTVPVLLLLVIAAIEFSRANMLLHTAAAATSEGARRGIIAGMTAEAMKNVVKQELSYVNIKEARILVIPEVVTNDTKVVAVAVEIPVNTRNGYIFPRFFLGDSVIKIAALPREAKNDPEMTDQIVDILSQAKIAVTKEPLEVIDLKAIAGAVGGGVGGLVGGLLGGG